MNIEVIDDGIVALIRPEGKLDSSNSAEFELAVNQVVNGLDTSLIVDLGKVSFMASAGLRVLLGAAKKLSADDRALRVFGLNGLVRETFEISGFVSILDISTSEAEAREGLK
ncbi:STAS domain-containing protein [Aliiroseovarius sp. KMU-50]|uniref:Anti-sigma factor antagonist n=1 Tax=Aliiroseovarius salicola TaxID=3009082 RepID=A0ABT4W6J5_9RHOB|nr:STAS domain-containing protein [Aliiroseovarius sp. KMU-50]MDA5095755.1 STAS domain-containing protein [Aliiroseovarius sp. KMU-50]